MKHKRFSDEQVIGVLKEHDAGAKVDDICRRHAISTATFDTWRRYPQQARCSRRKSTCPRQPLGPPAPWPSQ